MSTARGADEARTIIGVASGRPDGGVAVIRLSGPQAIAWAEEACGTLPKARVLGVRRLGLGVTHEQTLVAVMPAPASFTGEDVVELHVHGGDRNVRQVVEHFRDRGAAAAEAGEFTRRAFENGRLSLDQAEGIAAVIGAQTDAALAQARRLVAGELGAAVRETASEVLALRAEIEANLDFPEDVDPGDAARWGTQVARLRTRLDGWLGRFEAGRRARERARVVLAGVPNAGKSALFNALLGRERAIVADEAGTTRDFVEADLDLGDYGVTLVDTAGLRTTRGAIEAVGIAHAEAQIAGADLVLWLHDEGQADSTARARFGLESGAGTVIEVLSKADQRAAPVGERAADTIPVSAVTGEGLEDLRAAIARWFRMDAGNAWIGLARHRDRAEEARAALIECADALAGGAGLEVVAFVLGVAHSRLGEIVGEHQLGPVGEEVVAEIFARFCIGK